MTNHYGRTTLLQLYGGLFLLLALLALCTSGAEADDIDWDQVAVDVQEESVATISVFEPVYNVTFSGDTGDDMGILSWEDGVFKFTGKADESALKFFDYLKNYIDPYLQSERDEVAALLERCLEYVKDGDALQPMYDGSGGYEGNTVNSYTLKRVADQRLTEIVDQAKHDIQAAQDKVKALDRETKLRRDIEALLQKLKRVKP